MKKLLFLILVSAHFAVVNSQKIEYAQQLDQMIQTGMAEWKIPGLAAVVVKDGAIVFKKTYGVKNLDRKEPVNESTLFAMASTTKAMVAMALAILVDEGKVSWNDPVIQYLPTFQLSDSYITADARVKDLLTHNLGIANADVLWTLDSLSTQETLKRFAHTEKVYPLRGGFTYQNIMYAAAGELIEAVSGQSWSSFVEERLFKPLDMNRSLTKASDIQKAGNFVTPYYDFDQKGVLPVSRNYSDQIGAAGMMWSSVDDMGNYLKFIVNQGVHQNDTLIQPNTFSYLFQPQTLIPNNEFYPTTALTDPHWLSYGLGWFQHDYRGHKLDFHTGSLNGLVAMAGVMHDKKVAVYIFANLDHAELRHAILYQAIDLFGFDDNTTNWHPKIFELYQGFKKDRNAQQQKMADEQVKNTKPSKPIGAYTGIYEHPLCGKLTLTLRDETLDLNFNNFEQIAAYHWHYDTFMTKPNRRWTSPVAVTFQLNAKGVVQSLDFLGYTFTKTDFQP
ncbi:MAG: serine hydrolase [Croceitalea sp.]|nr:serine hydrolase [Croceitalea sp.]